MAKEINIVTAFAPLVLPPQVANTPVSEEDIIDTLIVDTYEIDDDGNVKPITKQIVTGKKNRKEYIESFSDDVGLQHILEKIGQGAIAEDKYSILNTNKIGSVTDLTGMQLFNNLGDIQALADKARVTFANLDPELKKGMSFQEFVTKFNNQDLIDYVTKKVTTEKGEGE